MLGRRQGVKGLAPDRYYNVRHDGRRVNADFPNNGALAALALVGRFQRYFASSIELYRGRRGPLEAGLRDYLQIRDLAHLGPNRALRRARWVL